MKEEGVPVKNEKILVPRGKKEEGKPKAILILIELVLSEVEGRSVWGFICLPVSFSHPAGSGKSKREEC